MTNNTPFFFSFSFFFFFFFSFSIFFFFFFFFFFDVERYVGWGCILNCFVLSSLPCFYAIC